MPTIRGGPEAWPGPLGPAPERAVVVRRLAEAQVTERRVGREIVVPVEVLNLNRRPVIEAVSNAEVERDGPEQHEAVQEGPDRLLRGLELPRLARADGGRRDGEVVRLWQGDEQDEKRA